MVVGGADITIGSPQVGDVIIPKFELRVEIIGIHMIERR